MAQNISTAVMARRTEAHDSLDFFPTPLWATRALCEHVLPEICPDLKSMSVYEPACGQGHMARALAEYFANVYAGDIHDYGYGEVYDFLFGASTCDQSPYDGVDFVITNPPFKLAQEFIEAGLEIAQKGVAVLVRSVFLEGKGRYKNLFLCNPPAIVAPFVERVPIVKGRVDRKASSATAYTWMVWSKKRHDAAPQVVWIPPCRKRLERDTDYVGVAP